ncbi:MAG TPA: GDSL-type esterase/lipase family protein [Opitutales bacterium]|jgi:lysophospholipase L1-like esterase|nr:GDSL-type esterase/lipase family protein [Opitutales bacterium]
MKNILLTFSCFISTALLAQTPAPAAASASASAAPAAASASASAAPAKSAATSTQILGDKHLNDVARYTQMGTVAVTGAPGNGRYFPPVPADPTLPTLWVIGDSTVRNGTLGDGVGNHDQWGWGAPIVNYFDMKKINIVNRAFGGTTSHSFYDGFFWKNMQPQIKKGDFVILQFGANDGSTPVGTGDQVNAQGMHTFGWYLKQFVKETRDQGGTCIICSLTPRKNWANGKMNDVNNHVDQAAQAAKEANAPYIDLHELIQRRYDIDGKDQVDLYYMPTPEVAAATNQKAESLHTGWDGSIVNAECVISGIKSLKTPLAAFLSDKAKSVAPAPADCVADNSASATTTESGTPAKMDAKSSSSASTVPAQPAASAKTN